MPELEALIACSSLAAEVQCAEKYRCDHGRCSLIGDDALQAHGRLVFMAKIAQFQRIA
ncbi:hypothetical protein [Variovorax sp.]|jgi:hypothetical protein|uniref:hypothetical protein n=1 Tax=Variovorax sp. TaxID=1871043 RepID=UPI0037DA0734